MILGAYMTLAALGSLTPPVRPAHQHRKHPAASVLRLPPDSSDLYSLRARRRFASYLRLRLLELREANLERAAAVIEHRLPMTSLLDASEQPAPLPVRGIPEP
jgi:hypothetical protein